MYQVVLVTVYVIGREPSICSMVVGPFNTKELADKAAETFERKSNGTAIDYRATVVRIS